jgi:hypothetical protein
MGTVTTFPFLSFPFLSLKFSTDRSDEREMSDCINASDDNRKHLFLACRTSQHNISPQMTRDLLQSEVQAAEFSHGQFAFLKNLQINFLLNPLKNS